MGAAEKIADESAKGRAPADKLNHTGGDGASQKASVIEAAGDLRGNLQIGGKVTAYAAGITLWLAADKRLRDLKHVFSTPDQSQ